MATSLAIRTERLGKQYTLGELNSKYDYFTFREMLVRTMQAPLRRLLRRPAATPARTRLWALRDLSVDIQRGEVVGVIGRNGAGKSTLLKILSRVTDPSEGRAEIRGRLGSLLEVATGFHPELTGRENIFLNGAILGMTRREIQRKFDEIVAFSDVERFLDTPVKRYSTGMYLRLAFSVAAHLEPEILLVDEVLAVGDHQFQAKCLGKMGQVASEGRTVLFVSHSMGAIAALTKTAIVLQQGRLVFHGPTSAAIEHYTRLNAAQDEQQFSPRGRSGTGRSRVLDARILDHRGRPSRMVAFGRPFSIALDYETTRATAVRAAITMVSAFGVELFTTHSDDLEPLTLRGQGRAICQVDPNYLAPGHYSLRITLYDLIWEQDDRIEQALDFEVSMLESAPSGLASERAGLFKLPLAWRLEP